MQFFRHLIQLLKRARKSPKLALAIFLLALAATLIVPLFKPSDRLQFLTTKHQIWATYTTGTNHTFYLRNGRPLFPQKLGALATWISSITRHPVFANFLVSRSNLGKPALFVYTGLNSSATSSPFPGCQVFLV